VGPLEDTAGPHFTNNFMKEFLSFVGVKGEVWCIFPNYVGKIIDRKIRQVNSGQIDNHHQPPKFNTEPQE